MLTFWGVSALAAPFAADPDLDALLSAYVADHHEAANAEWHARAATLMDRPLNPSDRFELDNFLWYTDRPWCDVFRPFEYLGDGELRSTIEPACYAKRLAYFATEPVHPISLHLEAHERVKKLQERLAHETGLPVSEALASLRDDRLDRTAVVAEALAEIHRQHTALATTWTLPGPCSVSTRFYDNDAVAFYEPGEFVIRPIVADTFPRALMAPMVAHECFGHHVERASAGKAPPWRQDPRGYFEGWATYAESLLAQAGVPGASGPGFTANHLWREVRIVVDTGVHARRWVRSEARAYYFENTSLPPTWVEIELDAIFENPGARAAHGVGLQRFVQLRSATETRLGKRFDARAYHEFLLALGPSTFGALSDRMATWEP